MKDEFGDNNRKIIEDFLAMVERLYFENYSLRQILELSKLPDGSPAIPDWKSRLYDHLSNALLSQVIHERKFAPLFEQIRQATRAEVVDEAIQYFSDSENCRQFMVSVRWPDGIVKCPNCGSEKVKYLTNAKVYRCYGNHPKVKFSLKVGTIFEDSAIALEKWLPCVWLIVNCKNGISSYEVHRALGVTQKTAWFMLHRIRLAMKTGTFTKLGGGDGGPVETDETFIGPNPRRMNRKRRAKLDAIATERGEKYRYAGKTIVMGMLDRNLRQVRATVIPDVKRSTLQEKILKHVEGGSHVITDDFPSYTYALADKFAHDVIDHTKHYVDGQIHTNGIENFWSLLKRGLRGTYVAVEPYHLERYVDEQVFRFNNRATKDNPLNDGDRFHMALSQIVGKRLTYAELTGKSEERLP